MRARSNKRAIKIPCEGTRCVISTSVAPAYGDTNSANLVSNFLGYLFRDEPVLYLKEQSALFSYFYSDFDWCFTHLGIVLISRSVLSLDT